MLRTRLKKKLVGVCSRRKVNGKKPMASGPAGIGERIQRVQTGFSAMDESCPHNLRKRDK